MHGTVKEPLLVKVRAQYEALVAGINVKNKTGHACLFRVAAGPLEAPLHELFDQREVFRVRACEGTNPVDVTQTDCRCILNSNSNLLVLNTQLASINGDMPRTSARSIVSEISSKSAENVTGLATTAVTYTTGDSSFYHSMISISAGYTYSADAGSALAGLPPATLPTVHMASIGHPETRTFAVEGKLLPEVTISGRCYTEADLIDMVVGSMTCLAPDVNRIVDMRATAGFQVFAGRPPPSQNHMARVVMHGRMLPLASGMTGVETTAAHVTEVEARSAVARLVHPGAVAVSINSHSWNLYVPQS